MDIRKIKKLIDLIHKTDVSELEVHSQDESVRISRMPQGQLYRAPVQHEVFMPHQEPMHGETKVSANVKNVPEGHAVKAPMVGTVYLAPTPGAKPFVEIGQNVSPGDTLCLIEAMKMFNKIEADKAGVLSARLIENEQPVEYDQTLFIIE